jgi:hypothetical protein
MKVDAKTPITSMAYSHRYFNLSGAHALLCTMNNSAVMAFYTLRALPPEQALRACLDVTGMVPPGERGWGLYCREYRHVFEPSSQLESEVQ